MQERLTMLEASIIAGVLQDAYSQSMGVPKYGSILEFFEDGFSLTDDDRFKRFELKYSPWCRELCRWWSDYSTPWIYLIFGSQLAKTSFMMGCLLYVSQYERGATPCIWVMSIAEEAKNFIKGRLKPFLDESGEEAIKKDQWKLSSFRVNNSSVKVGYATAKTTIRTKPCRYAFGDEIGLWKESTNYVKKRTRTFEGKRKGVFCTTPPDNSDHHSVSEMFAGNYYQWWVPCMHCGKYQGLLFKNLVFKEGKVDGVWDFEKVKECVRYKCEHCGGFWYDHQKLDIINKGKTVCVDPDTYESREERKSDSKTLQISALYSVFTEWGTLAIGHLKAEQEGYKARIEFITDELAEVPKKRLGQSLKKHELARFIDPIRKSGIIPGYNLYTAGIDVQRAGNLYYSVWGFKGGPVISSHLLKYGIVGWKDADGGVNWIPLLQEFADFRSRLYRATLDATDGEVTFVIYDFCRYHGKPFVPLRDAGTQLEKICFKSLDIDPRTGQKLKATGFKYLSVNSDIVKDEIATMFSRLPTDEGACTFPCDVEEVFLRHISNEHRTEEERRGRIVSTWQLRYSGAANHFFSTMVYAHAAMEDVRPLLQKAGGAKKSIRKARKRIIYPGEQL